MPRYLSEYDRLKSQGLLWTPCGICADLITYLDVRTPRGVEVSGSDVATVRDFARGNDYTQAVSGNRPAYIKDDITGVRAVQFDGVDEYVEQASALVGSSGEWSVFFMMRAGAYSQNNSGYLASTSSNNGTVQISEQTDNGDRIGITGTNDGGTTYNPLFAPIDHVEDRLYLLSYEFSSSKTTMYSDGEQVASENKTFQGALNYPTRLGYNRSLGRAAAMELFCLVIISGNLTDDLRRRLNAWAVWGMPDRSLRLRLPTDNPYRNRPPAIGA